MNMALAFLTSFLLVACTLGKALVVPLSPEEAVNTQSTPAVRNNRCQAALMLSIRKSILESLSLESEPQISVAEMVQIRDQWKTAFKGSAPSEPQQPNTAGNTISPASPEDSSSVNPVLQCCKFASQIFIKDLGWDKWIIYPESFTYIHCSGCDPNVATPCREDSASTSDISSQMPCCQPTAHDLVPFLYLDKTNSLTIASVQLTRECGCGPVDVP